MLAEGLPYPYHNTIYQNRDLKGQDPVKNAREFDVNLLFIFVRISVSQATLILPKIALKFIKKYESLQGGLIPIF